MIGTSLSGRYQIQAELGRGGMGVVYRAHDPQLGRDVAIKLVHPALLTDDTQVQLLREAQMVARMDHPAIVPVHDIGQHEGGLFLVMPLLAGRTLRSLLQEGPLDPREAALVAAQVAEALDYSHALGVVHRDVKPENVMVTREEHGRLRARVMDFGLAGHPAAVVGRRRWWARRLPV
jgi:serine/threonine-protein kinase